MGGVTKTQVVKFIRKGDKGDPSVVYEIVTDKDTLRTNDEDVQISVRIIEGDKVTVIDLSKLGTYGLTIKAAVNSTDISGLIELTSDSQIYGFSVVKNDILHIWLYSAGKLVAQKHLTTVANGEKGEQGATLRGPQAWSDCATGYAFQAGGSSEQWKDVVLYNGNYYSCVKSHTKTASNYPGSTTANNNGYWQLGDKIELVATKILLATYALVENLGVAAIDMKDAAGNILFQAKDGNVTCKTGTFENVNITGKLKGSVRNPFVSAGDSFDTDYSDNVVMISSGGNWIDAYSLPWDAGQSGRRITLVNYKWGSTVSDGQAGISAPTGKYFYMNGVQKSTLNISREAVELLGYGTATTFYGWIVLRRTDLMTTYRYGRELKVLAFGSVTSSGGLTYRTFDGSTLQCTKQSATGRYLITMPSGWFSSASHCTVLLTGVGYSSGSSSALIKASIVSRTTTTVLVGTSDDASANDGAFDFVIINNNDWIV